MGGWPLSRNVYAQLLKNLADSGNNPNAVGFDILLVDPSTSDKALAQQMARHHVVLSTELRYNQAHRLMEIQSPPILLAQTASQLAHINISFDSDGFIRGTRLMEGGVPHLSLAMAGKRIPKSQASNDITRFSLVDPSIGFTTISLVDAIDPNYPLSVFKNSYLLIGSTAPSLGDHYPSIYAGKQMSGTPGVVFQASLLNDILANHLISPVGEKVSFIFYVSLLILVLLGILLLTPSLELIFTSSLLLLSVLASIVLLLKFNYWLDPIPLLATVLFIKPLWAWRRMNMIVSFMDARTRELETFKVLGVKKTLLPQDTVLQYSNVLDGAIQMAKNRLDNFKKIINTLPEPVFALDGNQKIALTNAKFRNLFPANYFDQDVYLNNILLHFDYSYEQVEEILSLPLGEKYLQITTKEGAHREFMLHRVDVGLDDDNPFFLVMLVEVTALLQLQAQRDRTLQLLSHDMRTPIASIFALCRKIAAQGGQQDTVEQVGANAQRTLTMMDDFILSIKADESKYKLETILFDALLDQAVYEVKGLAEERNMQISVEQNELLFVQCEARLMERVLINLLVNAIRYGAENSVIYIAVSLQYDESGKSKLRCQISNVIDAINKNSETRVEHRGFGLGLSFVDQVIEKHHGMITRQFATEPHGLALVTINLPCSSE